MRDIKFRAWDTDKQEMAHVSHMNFDDYEVCLQNEGGTWYSAGHYTAYIMQCTGLKDKNGKEIYEGDIIEIVDSIGTHRCVVKFVNGCFISIEVGDSDEVCLREDIDNFPHTVIGNIYENPELLEV